MYAVGRSFFAGQGAGKVGKILCAEKDLSFGIAAYKGYLVHSQYPLQEVTACGNALNLSALKGEGLPEQNPFLKDESGGIGAKVYAAQGNNGTKKYRGENKNICGNKKQFCVKSGIYHQQSLQGQSEQHKGKFSDEYQDVVG